MINGENFRFELRVLMAVLAVGTRDSYAMVGSSTQQ